MKVQTSQLVIASDGTITVIYTDELAELLEQGITEINRVSFVEPGNDGWYADLSPIQGPKLGPFRLRSDALDAEIKYLEAHLFGRPDA